MEYLDCLGEWLFGYAWPVVLFFCLIAAVTWLGYSNGEVGEWLPILSSSVLGAFVFLPPLIDL